MSTEPDQPTDLADDDPVVKAVASRLGATLAASKQPTPAAISPANRPVDAKAAPPTIATRPLFSAPSVDSQGPADDPDRTALPGGLVRPVDGPAPSAPTVEPPRLGVGAADRVDLPRPPVDSSRDLADAGSGPSPDRPTLARLPGLGLFGPTAREDLAAAGRSADFADAGPADPAPTIDLRGRFGGESAGFGLFGGETSRPTGLDSMSVGRPSVDGSWGPGGASSLGAAESSPGLGDLSKTNDLLQQLLDAFRRQRGAPLPPSGGSIVADR